MRETERLRRDVANLHGRIEPFDGEVPLPKLPERHRRMRNFVDVFASIDEASRAIRGSEYALTHMEGTLEGISSDAISRSEMKWLKER